MFYYVYLNFSNFLWIFFDQSMVRPILVSRSFYFDGDAWNFLDRNFLLDENCFSSQIVFRCIFFLRPAMLKTCHGRKLKSRRMVHCHTFKLSHGLNSSLGLLRGVLSVPQTYFHIG